MTASGETLIPLVPPILAQIPAATRSEIVTWIIAGAAVLAILKLALDVYERLRTKPPPSETYVAKTDCRAAHKELTDCLERIEADRRDAFRELRTDIGGVHRRVDAVLERLTKK